MNRPAQPEPFDYDAPLPEGVYDNFTYQCRCGATVTVAGSVTRPHECKGTKCIAELDAADPVADAWDEGRRAGQMDPYGLYPTTNPYRAEQ